LKLHTVCVVAVILLLVVSVSGVSASLMPSTLSATLKPGESVSEMKTVFLLSGRPKVDVVFSFDLSNSMTGYFAAAKSLALSIMAGLDSFTVDAAFGVVSHMDYPHTYSSYGYWATYGVAAYGDYAYKLDQPLTENRSLVQLAASGLKLGCGSVDSFEDYARVMFESYSDSGVGWRECTKRFLIMFSDSNPHDDNLNEGMAGKALNWSTGGDPGRDEVMFTGDDVDLQGALAEMAANRVVLLPVRYGWMVPSSSPYWQRWAGLTGGAVYTVSNASSVASDILSSLHGVPVYVNKLTLKAQSGYESWLTQVNPAEYTDIDVPAEGVNRTFSIKLTVPGGTMGKQYKFKIVACADGACVGEQQVTITVVKFVVPEFWMGPVLGLTGCFAAFGVHRLVRRRKS